MSFKIAAESFPKLPEKVVEELVHIREYDEGKDKVAVEAMERRCEVGQRGKPSIVTDLLGDPICRIRHFPSHIMLVAEYGEEKEMVGIIRGCVKTVTKGNLVYVKLAYILGLRISPSHRRFGIGTKLVKQLEEWCKLNGTKYVYMATDCTNEPSINLFTKKCSYTKFRTPTMLVQPVHAHCKPLGSDIAIVRVPTRLSESIYRQVFANSEFFPKDIDAILANNLSLGTFMAISKKDVPNWDPKTGIHILPSNYAILSVWNTKEVFKLQVKGVSTLKHVCCKGTRLLDSWMPWLKLPSIPNVFKKFGVYFMFGLHMEGENGSRLIKSLCRFVHNMGKDDGGCGSIVTEVGNMDPVRAAIPHWKKFSWAEDLWCIKRLNAAKRDDEESETLDWITSRSSSSVIFVDPRDF